MLLECLIKTRLFLKAHDLDLISLRWLMLQGLQHECNDRLNIY